MASVVGGMSVTEVASTPAPPVIVVKSEPQEFLLPPQPSLPPPSLAPVNGNPFNCLVSEKWMTTIKTEPLEFESSESVPLEFQPSQLAPLEFESSQQAPLEFQPSELAPLEFEPSELATLEFQPSELATLEFQPSATLVCDDFSKSMIAASAHIQRITNNRGNVGKSSFKRIIENPRGEARLRRKMQMVDTVEPNFLMLKRYERLARKRRQEYYASLSLSSTSCKNNRSNTNCQSGKESALSVRTTDKTRTRSNYSDSGCFEKVNEQPEAEKETEKIINDSSLTILADDSILTSQPRVVLTRCDGPKLMPEESKANHEAELHSKSKPNKKSKSRRSPNVQKKTRKRRVKRKAVSYNTDRPIRSYSDVRGAGNVKFKKIVDNPILEAQAAQIFSRCTVRHLTILERNKLKIPPFRSDPQKYSSSLSTASPSDDNSTSSRGTDSYSSLYSTVKVEMPSGRKSLRKHSSTIAQSSLGDSCTNPIPHRNFRKNSSSSISDSTVSNHPCSVSFEITGNAGKESVRIKADPSDSIKIQPAPTELEAVSTMCTNSKSTRTQNLSSASIEDYPHLETDSTCESSMSLQTQSVCTEPHSDSNATSVCDTSEFKKTQCYKTRDSDIFSFCNRIIESATTEARFEDIVNKMSSRFSNNSSPNF